MRYHIKLELELVLEADPLDLYHELTADGHQVRAETLASICQAAAEQGVEEKAIPLMQQHLPDGFLPSGATLTRVIDDAGEDVNSEPYNRER